MTILHIFLGFILLIFGGDMLLRAAVDFSIRLKIPKMIIGMTVVSFATSAPECIVSLNAALAGHADFSLGNVIGSNIANIGLILGITVLLGSIHLEKNFLKKELFMFFLSSFLLYVLLYFGKSLNRFEGFLLIGILVFHLWFLIKKNRKTKSTEIKIDVKPLKLPVTWAYFLLGGFGLWMGSRMLLVNTISLAENLGISERIISISMISVGTSLPELAASIIAILKKEKFISLGNIIGSNIFNILAVLGITASIQPIHLQDLKLMEQDIFWMLGFTMLLPVLAIIIFKKNHLAKKEGLILLLFYFLYLYFILK